MVRGKGDYIPTPNAGRCRSLAQSCANAKGRAGVGRVLRVLS
jgi:hypothetical protein